MEEEIIKFKWELEKEYKYFKSTDELVKELRRSGVDKNNEISDQYLIDESHQIGEWEYITK